MKLYYAPAAASLAAHIIACEAGLRLDLIKVDLQTKRTEFGEDFYQINPNGYVPLLIVDDGHQLTETAVILQYLADLTPEKQLIPLAGEFSRYQVQQWLNFIASEIHKGIVTLFNPTLAGAVKEQANNALKVRLATVANQLTAQDYLVGERFTVADAYLFIALNALRYLNFDISAWSVLAIYQAKIAARPAVQQAMREEGLLLIIRANFPTVIHYKETIMQQKLATTSVKIHDIIQTRWSPRAFDANKSVIHEDLLALLEAARWASSCFNDQPWRFVVCDKSADAQSWENAFSILADKNKLWAKNAPVLMLSVAMGNFNHNGNPNRWAAYDTGAACANLSLQATALGLVVHQMGGFDAEKARAVFNLPDDCTPMAMMAVGYQADIEVLDEDFKAAELATRSRATLEERFYAGQWGKAVEK